MDKTVLLGQLTFLEKDMLAAYTEFALPTARLQTDPTSCPDITQMLLLQLF